MIKKILTVSVFTLIFCSAVFAEKKIDSSFVHGLFTNDMILQRDVACPVWGWASPGDSIVVSFAGQTKNTVADTEGRWEVKLDPMPANTEGRDMIVEDQTNKKKTIFKNVVVGDIWLCSGQSNMEFGIMGANQWWNELPKKPMHGIRLFWVQPTPCFSPQKNVIGNKWQIASSQSLRTIKNPYTSVAFSAIAWFYGRKLHKETNIPIGLIESSQGNTAIQPWSAIESLRKQKGGEPDMTSLSAFEKMYVEWLKSTDPNWSENQKWLAVDYDDGDWKDMEVGKSISSPFDGVTWLRKRVELSKKWAGKALTLDLGTLSCNSAAWFNGHFLGTGEKRNGNWRLQLFSIPAALVKEGANVIVIRLDSECKDNKKSAGLFLKVDKSGEAISLSGKWKMKESTPKKERLWTRHAPNAVWGPGVLYNGMIFPLSPFAIKGAIWYQGEGNSGQTDYGRRLTDMIRDWRALFNIGDFPFFIVQLANFRPLPDKPAESSWAVTRELQAKVAREVPNSGLAVAIDRGEIYDIHPPNKRDVGERLALVALAKTYKQDIPCEGPTFKSITIDGDRAVVSFDHAKGLKSLGGAPTGFAICGEDKKWEWANARIVGESVEIWNSDIKKPVAVRYGWGENIICNLYNEANLPAVPFRTKW